MADPGAASVRTPSRVHIVGASGSGTTSLGGALAARFGHRHLDTDDFFWVRTDPPYREKRPREERLTSPRPARGLAGRPSVPGVEARRRSLHRRAGGGDRGLDEPRESFYPPSSNVLTYTPGDPGACFMCGRMRWVSGAMSRWASQAGVSETRSEEHTSELQSRFDLVCRLLLEKKKKKKKNNMKSK